jgi:hypothetical protein
MLVLAAEISAHDLLEVVVVSLVAGVAITALYSLVVRWGAKTAEAARTGHNGGVLAYGTLTVVAFLVFAAGVIYGVQVMLSSK